MFYANNTVCTVVTESLVMFCFILRLPLQFDFVYSVFARFFNYVPVHVDK